MTFTKSLRNSNGLLLTKLLLISGSPIENGSTESMLHMIADSFCQSIGADAVESDLLRLNEWQIIPCQSCGQVPAKGHCFFEDIESIYKKVVEADCIIFGSPVYFDSVSAQSKLFIDRCNCMRPPDFGRTQSEHSFIKKLDRKRPGAIVLVGGDNAWFEGARRTIAGFFKWIEVVNAGHLTYQSADFDLKAGVTEDRQKIEEARFMGAKLADEVKGRQ